MDVCASFRENMGHGAKTDRNAVNTDERGLVFNVMRFAVHDGPGIRTTVFLKGCPLRCPWCHNPESQSVRPEVVYFAERCMRCGDCVRACPNGALALDGDVHVDEKLCRRCGTCADTCLARAREIAGEWVTVDDLLGRIERDRVFYEESGGGVTLSGGEPLQQAQFAERLLQSCRERGIHTVVDTCGYAPAASFQRVAEHVDLFLFDLKVIDGDQHREVTGVPNELILNNLRWLAEQNRPVIVRVPVIPGYTDSDANLSAISKFVRSLGLQRIDLLPYHHIAADKYRRLRLKYRMDGVAVPAPERMSAIAESLSHEGFGVRIGG